MNKRCKQVTVNVILWLGVGLSPLLLLSCYNTGNVYIRAMDRESTANSISLTKLQDKTASWRKAPSDHD